jgi:hypothetical protein
VYDLKTSFTDYFSCGQLLLDTKEILYNFAQETSMDPLQIHLFILFSNEKTSAYDFFSHDLFD